MLTRKTRIGLIGAGNVGKTLAAALMNKGYTVVSAASRTFESAKALARLAPGCVAHPNLQDAADAAEIVFITTSDDAIQSVASTIQWRKGQMVVHCSGAASLDVLESVRTYGAIPAAFHPLQTFSSVEEAVGALPGSTFGIEGDEDTRRALAELAEALGGTPIFLRSEDKALYHATVVMAGGVLNTLIGAVAERWAHFGVDRNDALKAITPIMAGTAETLFKNGLPAAAAGPFVRGDVGTIRKHVDAMQRQAPELLTVYCRMALAGLHVAAEKGVAPRENIEEIRGVLTEAVEGQEDRSCALPSQTCRR